MSNSPHLPLRLLHYHELHSGKAFQWLWHGYLAPGNVTLLTSQWKAGKTTLIAALLHHMKVGGSLADQPVQTGNAIVLSEEDPTLWYERGRRFDFSNHVRWLCRPFQGKPTKEQFHKMLDQLLALHAETGLSLVVIDSLAAFLPPGSENNADAMVAFLASLQRLTAAGMAVLILHHPAKKAKREGQAARGSGALSGAVDVLIEMHWVSRPSSTDRRRRLKAWSRFSQTPAKLVIELNAAGTDYTVFASTDRDAKSFTLPEQLHKILREAPYRMTSQEILQEWPYQDRPTSNLLRRWLHRAYKADIIDRQGAGNRYDPYVFWLPEREKVWNENPIHKMVMENFEKWKQEHPEEYARKKAENASYIR